MIGIAAPELGETERQNVIEVLDSGTLADGPEVRAFEREFADYCGATHGIATSNGTTALHAALVALGIGEGDTVLTTPFSFIATANSIRFSGATPIFGDIDPRTFNLDPESVEESLRTGEVDAMMPVHLYGLPADIPRLQELAERYDVSIVEDAAQAHGARHGGQLVGSFGDVACFSFYPTKNMTTGEGGMIVTDDDETADRARRFINHGRAGTYDHVELGHNFRMTSIQAAIGRAQLSRLPGFIRSRRRNAELLTEGLEGTSVTTPSEPAGTTHAFHQYTIRTPERGGLQADLADHGIESGIYYPRCIHEQPAYEHLDVRAPVAEAAAREVLSIPVHPGVTEDEILNITDCIQTYDNEH